MEHGTCMWLCRFMTILKILKIKIRTTYLSREGECWGTDEDRVASMS